MGDNVREPAGSDRALPSAEFATLRAQLDAKPGTWQLLALFVAALAVPMAIIVVWVPREVDSLKAVVTEARDNAAAAAAGAEAAAEASVLAAERLDDLIRALARENAKRLRQDLDHEKWLLAAEAVMREILPTDLYNEIVESGNIDIFEISDFLGFTWIFVDRSDFNMLSSSQQRAFQAGVARAEVRFHVE